MAGATFFRALDRVGLLKYALAGLFALLALALTAGAFFLDELSRRPPARKALPVAWLERQTATPAPGWIVRAPVVRSVRFAADSREPVGFAFYDITAADTPDTLAAKCVRQRFRLGRVQGEACDFAAALADQGAPASAVAAFVKARGRDCCGLARAVPGQLATYVFGQGQGKAGATTGPVRGAAVFSEVGGGLLSLTLRFTEHVEGYAAAVTRHLEARCGPSAPLPGEGAAWARDGGLVTLNRQGRVLVVTAYYLANIDRHAARARDLAERRQQREPAPGGRLALVGP